MEVDRERKESGCGVVGVGTWKQIWASSRVLFTHDEELVEAAINFVGDGYILIFHG